MPNATWLRFETLPRPKDRKTDIFRVLTTDGEHELGVVRWYGRWRCFAFFPKESTLFEATCLRDLAAFCQNETARHRGQALGPVGKAFELTDGLQDLARRLEQHRFAEGSEAALQQGVEAVLERASIDFTREAKLSAGERLDFVVHLEGCRVALECKVDGSLAAVTRQLMRYAQLADVRAVLLVTTRLRHAKVPATLNGKPVRVVCTMGGML